MCHRVLTRLRDDHGRFELLFSTIERECDADEAGQTINHGRLKAIAAYFGTRALPLHHAIEDAIFTHLLGYFPSFREEIYDLLDDHIQSKREFDGFLVAVETVTQNFVEAARSFVANERGHFISEEEVFFPYAEKTLTTEEWDAVETGLVAMQANGNDDQIVKELLQS